jgi:hypothetical protein
LAQYAHATGSFVRIDMEHANLSQFTLDIVRLAHSRPDARDSIGVVIQAYLYRSQADIEQLLADGIRVRLCKGAYKEPPEVAFPRKADVDANFIELSHMLLDSPIYHAMATHDEAMVAAVKKFSAAHSIEPSRFEFQMLYGIRRDLQRQMVRECYNVRVYVPSALSGTPISCAAWPSAPPTSSSSPKTISAPKSLNSPGSRVPHPNGRFLPLGWDTTTPNLKIHLSTLQAPLFTASTSCF